MSVPSGRSRAKFLVIGCTVLVAVAVIFGYVTVRDRPEPGAIVDILAIDADHAAVIRTVRDQPKRAFVSLFARGRGELWGALLPFYVSDRGHGSGLAATAEVVAVRAVASHGPRIAAFAGRGGRLLGRVSPVSDERAGGASLVVPGVGALYGQGIVYEVFGNGEGTWAEVYAIDMRDGRVMWRAELGGSVSGPAWVREQHLVMMSGKEVLVIARESGATTQRVTAVGRPCVLADVMYVPQADGIREVTLGGGEERMIALGGAFGGLCGRAGERLVLAMEGGLVAVDKASLAEVWRAPEAGAGEVAGSHGMHEGASERRPGEVEMLFPDTMPLAGELLPYVPVLAGGRVTMVEIADGAVLWQSPVGVSWGQASMWRAGERYYIYDDEREVLAVLGGASGEVEAAVSLSGCGQVWPDQVADSRVWLGCGEDWVVLDGATLAVVGHSAAKAPVFANARDKVAAELGASR